MSVDKKFLVIGIGIMAISAIVGVTLIISMPDPTDPQKTNENIGLVINTPSQSVSLQQIDEIFTDASSSGIGRSNVYLFWNIVEPERGEFDWSQSDVLMGLNEKNDLKVTLFFSVINGETLGPFPNWIGKPSLNSIGEERLTNVLDEILSRYHIIDYVIIGGETESQFRYYEQNIPVYQKLFSGVYENLKEKHPDVKFGNSFALHHVLNKNLEHIVNDLALGDFVAFSYFPVDSLNDIVKTPEEAKSDLEKVFEIVPNKQIALFEVSFSTSKFVGGNTTLQENFIDQSFEFYNEHKSDVEFLTWYRYYDKPEGTCIADQQKIGDERLSVGGGSGLGTSEHVIERLNHYVCNAGLVDTDGNPKSGWTEFINQTESFN